MICDRLKILLDELNISQRQFAMKINLDAGYFSKIMRGKVNPPDRILLLIENVFNVNKDWLENGQGGIFSNQGVSLAKKQVLESIDSLSDEQVNAVSSFIKYLKAPILKNDAGTSPYLHLNLFLCLNPSNYYIKQSKKSQFLLPL